MPSIAEIRQKYPQYEDMSDNDLASALHKKHYADMPRAEFDQKIGLVNPTTDRATREADKLEQMGLKRAPGSAFFDGIVNGATFGFADEVSSAINAPFRAVRDKTGLGEAYTRESALQQEQQGRVREDAPVQSMVGDVAGGLMTGGALMKGGLTAVGRLPQSAGIASRVGAGAAEGAGYGALYGAGNAQSGERMEGAGQGALMGGVAGGALPAIGAISRGVTKPIVDAVSARVNPKGFADRKIVERVTQSGKSMDQIGNKMTGGLSMADAGGKSTNTLLRTATNIPGAAKDKANAQLTLRQFGQGERLKTAISKTFADPDAYLSVKDDIATQARQTAAPLYNEAYSTPVPFTESLESILKTNAGKQALSKAKALASNEQAPFKSFFANVADDGTVDISRVPDMRAWDYIKRSLDDMIDAQTDSITRKTTNEGRILVGLKNKLIAELDQHVPSYAAARKASADGFKIDEALEIGRKSRLMEPEALKRATAGMSAPEKEALRVGAAEGLRKRIDDAGMTANGVLRIFSNRREIANLRTLFDNDKQFVEFRKAIFAEARKRATYDAVKGNSSTAAQMADMMEAGGLTDIANAATTATTVGPISATMQFIGSRLRMLGGLTPEVADSISQRLMTTNPNAAKQMIAQLQQIEKSQASKQQKAQAVSRLVYPLIGMGAGQMANQ